MKYLDAPELAHLADILEYSSAECKVHTRFGQSPALASPFVVLARMGNRPV